MQLETFILIATFFYTVQPSFKLVSSILLITKYPFSSLSFSPVSSFFKSFVPGLTVIVLSVGHFYSSRQPLIHLVTSVPVDSGAISIG